MSVQIATDQDFQDILNSNSKVVVKYQASWCGNCRLFAPKFKRLSNEDEFSDVIFIDVDAEKNPETRKMGGVDNLPFLASFKDGQLVEGSASSKEEYLRKLLGGLN